MGPAQNGSDRAIPPLAPRSCPIGPCRRKYDLSRDGVGSVPGTPVDSRGDPAGLPSFPGIAGWLAAAVPAALSSGTVSRSSDVPGSRNCRCRTPTRNPASGKTTAVRSLLRPSHPSWVWTTALLRGTPAILWSCPLTGAAMKKTPIAAMIGVSFFQLRYCLDGASANRSDEENSVSRYRRSSEKPQAPVRAYAWSIFFTSTRSALRAANRKWAPEPAGLRVMEGESGRLQIAAAPGAAKRELEGMESRVDWERDRRSVVHPPVTALEPVRARAGRFVLLRGACVIHGNPTSGPGCFMTGGPDRQNSGYRPRPPIDGKESRLG